MENEKSLTEGEYDKLSQSLSLGWSFTKFGNASLDTITRLCKERGLNADQTGDVEDAYARHPKRTTSATPQQQGK